MILAICLNLLLSFYVASTAVQHKTIHTMVTAVKSTNSFIFCYNTIHSNIGAQQLHPRPLSTHWRSYSSSDAAFVLGLTESKIKTECKRNLNKPHGNALRFCISVFSSQFPQAKLAAE